MQGADNTQPDMAIFRLTEGYVLVHGDTTVALTSADDLAERVREVARGAEWKEAEPEHVPAHLVVTPTPHEPSPPVPPLPVPAQVTAPPPTTLSLEQQWANARMLIAFFAAGFDANGKAFTRKEWDAAVPMFAPDLDPKQVEWELGEFMAEMRDDDE